jgi:epoxyqueuosine reductase
MMKYVKEPTYKKYIQKELNPFDDRNTAFSRGAVEGNKYSTMHENCIKNLKSVKKNKSIIDHATWVAGATVDYVVRRNLLGRETKPIYNDLYQLKNTNPEGLTRIIKEKARWLGANDVGVATINPAWIYTHWGNQNVNYSQAAEVGDPIQIPPEFNTVIVMIHEMGYDVIKRSPGIEYDTDIEYSRGAWCASSLATFITELGYRAIPAVNELGINIAMAVDAGLGELGRNGQLITRDYGPRVRMSKVFTNLPLVVDKPVDLGVQKFCENCKLCAKHCPSNSIPDGERTAKSWNLHNVEGMLKWPVKAMKCLDYWVKNGNHCSVCIRVCPWNKPNNMLHKFVRFFAEHSIFPKVVVYLDQLLGFGKQVKVEYPELDLEPELLEKE